METELVFADNENKQQKLVGGTALSLQHTDGYGTGNFKQPRKE